MEIAMKGYEGMSWQKGKLLLGRLAYCTDCYKCKVVGDCIFRVNKLYMEATYAPAIFFNKIAVK